jgi:hypothetical protein
MRNESDERGIKLMTRSPWWKDYTLTTDIELLMQIGHALVSLCAAAMRNLVSTLTPATTLAAGAMSGLTMARSAQVLSLPLAGF